MRDFYSNYKKSFISPYFFLFSKTYLMIDFNKNEFRLKDFKFSVKILIHYISYIHHKKWF